MSRWSFPGVRRALGDRPHSGFSNWFTYKWVARVKLGAGRAVGVQWLIRRTRGEVQRPLMSGFSMPAGNEKHRLLFEKQEYFNSKSHDSSRWGNISSSPRVITVREGTGLHESLFSKQENLSSASYHCQVRSLCSTSYKPKL